MAPSAAQWLWRRQAPDPWQALPSASPSGQRLATAPRVFEAGSPDDEPFQYPLVHVELQSIVLALAIRDLVDRVGHILAVAVVLGGQLLATFPVHQNQVPIVPIDENRID